MKTNPSKNRFDRDDAVLWVGSTDHRETKQVFQWCQKHVDMIAIRQSIQDAIDSPPRCAVGQVLVAQTNRYDVATLPSSADAIAQLRRQTPHARLLVIRGPLVAPTVAMPATDSSASSQWIESISGREAIAYLEACRHRRNRSTHQVDLGTTPIVIIASHYAIAGAYIDAISMMDASRPRWATWQRKLSPQTSRGVATILWDDSVATPTTGEQWKRRLSTAPQSRHLWATGIATTAQCQLAKENGIAAIIEKPGRLDCLLEAIRSV